MTWLSTPRRGKQKGLSLLDELLKSRCIVIVSVQAFFFLLGSVFSSYSSLLITTCHHSDSRVELLKSFSFPLFWRQQQKSWCGRGWEDGCCCCFQPITGASWHHLIIQSFIHWSTSFVLEIRYKIQEGPGWPIQDFSFPPFELSDGVYPYILYGECALFRINTPWS